MALRELHLRDYLTIIHKHDFVILTSFLLIFGSAFIFSLHIPKTYESSAKIQAQSTSGSGVSSAGLFQGMLAGGAEQVEMETLCRRLSSESLLTSVVNGLQDDDETARGAEFLPSIGALKAKVKAQIVSGSRLINVSIRLKEEEGGERNAAILINRLIGRLQSDISKEKKGETQSQMSALDKVIEEEVNKKKEEQQRELFDFIKQNGIPRIWYEEFRQVLTTRREIEALVENTTDSIDVAKLELEKLNDELKKYPNKLVEYSQTVTDSPVFLDLMGDLHRVDARIANASEALGADLGQLKGLEAQKTKIESQIHDFKERTTVSLTKTISPMHLALLHRKIDVEFRLDRLKVFELKYEARLKEFNAKLAQLGETMPKKEYGYGEIVESINRLERLGMELFKRKVDAQTVREKFDIDNTPFKGGILVIDPARPKRVPVGPNLTRIWAAAIFIGVAIGLVTAGMIEYLNNSSNT